MRKVNREAAEFLVSLRKTMQQAYADATVARDSWSEHGSHRLGTSNQEYFYIGKREGLALALAILDEGQP